MALVSYRFPKIHYWARVVLAQAKRPTSRAGETIREVGGGTKPWGPSRKRVPKCLKGPKTTYTTILIAEKQEKRSKKGPFCYILGPPGSHPGNGINEARRGRSSRSPPPGFSSHANVAGLAQKSRKMRDFGSRPDFVTSL